MPFDFVCNNMSLPSFAMGFDASNEHRSACTPHVVANTLSDSAIVARTSELSSDACNGGVETTNELQEVSVPDSNEESNEGVQRVAPKNKQRMNYGLTWKFQSKPACKV